MMSGVAIAAWIFLAIWRIVWSLLPQPGYIHPDEFFQSPEVLAGDVFDFLVLRTWEFRGPRPIRCIAFPYVTAGLPFRILKYVADNYFADADFVDAYTLTVFPRVAMVALSFLNDLFLFRICRKRGLPTAGLVLGFAGSYVATVYATRTLSNAIELLLTTTLLCCVFANRGRKYTRTRRHKATSVDRDGNVATVTRTETVDAYRSNPVVAACVPVIIVAGIFNRPTFIFYATVPAAVWLFEDRARSLNRLVSFFAIGGATAIAFISADSYYYNSENIRALIFDGVFASKKKPVLDSVLELMNALVVTPVNFVVYNSDRRNLAEHGVHPYFLHSLVNLPLLFGPVVFLALMALAQSVRDVALRRCRKIQTAFALCVAVPLAGLSAFPHQEPRFVVPLIAPVLLLIGQRRFAGIPWTIVGATWLVFNLTAFLVYALFHQAGLYPCLSYLQRHLRSEASTQTDYHVVFYHTYMPPLHLLTVNKFDAVGYVPANISAREAERVYRQKVRVHDLAGAEVRNLEYKINNIIDDHKATGHAKKTEIYIVLPATLENDLCRERGFYQLIGSFGPHLSFEDPPDWKAELMATTSGAAWCERYCLHEAECARMTAADRWSHVLSLQLYKVTLEDKLATPPKTD
ncbi:GPI alpha-1,2-mannosyltransferase 4-like [Tubulanus polymorphus]|uniref:GPI alpha-1,2-mannosyltransferase 4-like n=1 Tax=Tubulanus polymorphus TaxID=672921 RepID=UPI003DA2F0F5